MDKKIYEDSNLIIYQNVPETTMKSSTNGNLFESKNFITCDFGYKKRNDLIEGSFLVTYKTQPSPYKLISLKGECSCTSGNIQDAYNKKDNIIYFKYASKRIGIQDKGNIEKTIMVTCKNGKKIFIKLKITEKL